MTLRLCLLSLPPRLGEFNPNRAPLPPSISVASSVSLPLRLPLLLSLRLRFCHCVCLFFGLILPESLLSDELLSTYHSGRNELHRDLGARSPSRPCHHCLGLNCGCRCSFCRCCRCPFRCRCRPFHSLVGFYFGICFFLFV